MAIALSGLAEAAAQERRGAAVPGLVKTRARRPAHARRRGLGDTSAGSPEVSFAALVRPGARDVVVDVDAARPASTS